MHELAKEGRTYTTDDRFDHIIKWRSKNWPKHMKEMEKSDMDEKDKKDDGNLRKAPKRGPQGKADNVFFQEALQRGRAASHLPMMQSKAGVASIVCA